MPLCFSLIRSAVHSLATQSLLNFILPRCRPQLRWHSIRTQQQTYTTALAEHQQDEASPTSLSGAIELPGDAANILLGEEEAGDASPTVASEVSDTGSSSSVAPSPRRVRLSPRRPTLREKRYTKAAVIRAAPPRHVRSTRRTSTWPETRYTRTAMSPAVARTTDQSTRRRSSLPGKRQTRTAMSPAAAPRSLRPTRRTSTLPDERYARNKAKSVARAQARARRTAYIRGLYLAPFRKSVRSEHRGSAVYSPLWNVQFTRQSRCYDQAQPQYFLKPPAALPLSVDAFERVDEVLEEMDRTFASGAYVFSMKAIADRHGMPERELWAETALWLICYEKDKLRKFLLATHAPPYSPINWVEDCLQVLARHLACVPMSEGDREVRFPQLIAAFLVLVDRETKEHFVANSSFLRLLLPYCRDKQINEIWTSIKSGRVRVHSHTLLHFVDYFGNHDQFERALDALLRAKDAGAMTGGVAFRSGCSLLLRKSSSEPGGFRVCLRLVEHLGHIGVPLDTRLYNIIILNAIEAGDVETANNLYRAMLEQGLEPSKYTCAIRLKGCKLDIDNATMLREVIQDSIKYGQVRIEALVSGEVLHCLALHHGKHNPETAFATLAAAYIQFFEAAPLERLGLTLPHDPTYDKDNVEQQRMQPSRHVIMYMLLIFLDRNASSQEAIDLYTRWRKILEAGDDRDAALLDCATTPHLSNIFLHRFTRAKSTLLQAAQVVKDMQKPLPIQIFSSTGGPVHQAEPDIYTWSIFLHGFASHGEIKLAEQALAYMRSKGMEPNFVTWTSLLSGYAGRQDAEGLVDAVRRAEEDGFSSRRWNEWTRRGVERLRDRGRLKEMLWGGQGA